MNQPFDAKQPLRIGGGLGAANRFRGQIAEVRVYRRALSAEEVAVLAVGEPVSRHRADAAARAHRGAGGEATVCASWNAMRRDEMRAAWRTCSICASSASG